MLNICPVKKKKYCKNCNRNGHNLIQCWYANRTRKPKSNFRQAQSDDTVNRNLRKYVTDIFNIFIKFQFDLGPEISINWRSWRNFDKPTLLKMDKTEKSVTGENINFLGEKIFTVTLNGVIKKLEGYILKKFGQPVRNRLDRKIQCMWLSTEYILSQNKKYNVQFDKSQKELEQPFPQVFFWRPWRMFWIKS